VNPKAISSQQSSIPKPGVPETLLQVGLEFKLVGTITVIIQLANWTYITMPDHNIKTLLFEFIIGCIEHGA